MNSSRGWCRKDITLNEKVIAHRLPPQFFASVCHVQREYNFIHAVTYRLPMFMKTRDFEIENSNHVSPNTPCVWMHYVDITLSSLLTSLRKLVYCATAVQLLYSCCCIQTCGTGHRIPTMAAAPSRSFVVIVAATAGSLGIGKNGTLPWRLGGDMAYFKKVTSTPSTPSKVNAVIMGRKTWQSIPDRFRPLSGRRNVVLSRNPAARKELMLPEGVLLAGSLTEALALLARPPYAVEVDKVFVIGGGAVYNEAVGSSSVASKLSAEKVGEELCEKVLMTSVRTGDGRFDDCDVHFPALAPERFRLVSRGPVQEENGVEYSFDVYENILHTSARKGENDAASVARSASDGSTDGASVAEATADGQEYNRENADQGSGSVRPKRKQDEVSTGSSVEMTQEGSLGRETAIGSNGAVLPPEGTASARVAGEKDEEGGGNEEEMQYLRLVEDILENGVRRGDRTGTGTLSRFGVHMRFSLRQNRFPLLTTKRVFWRGVAEELLWFISGCTNANILQEKGIHIWDGNGSREFLDG